MQTLKVWRETEIISAEAGSVYMIRLILELLHLRLEI